MTLPRCALRTQSDAALRAREPAPRRWLTRLAVIAALVGATSTAAAAQTSSVSGTVHDAANAPIVAAQVSIVGTRYAAATDNNGHYRISGLPDPVGTAVTVSARRIGYKGATAAAHVGDENVDFRLEAELAGDQRGRGGGVRARAGARLDLCRGLDHCEWSEAVDVQLQPDPLTGRAWRRETDRARHP